MVLVSIFDPRRKKSQEQSENCITRRLKMCGLHKTLAGNKIKETEMSKTCSTSDRAEIRTQNFSCKTFWDR
jgi:hypothetical protein